MFEANGSRNQLIMNEVPHVYKDRGHIHKASQIKKEVKGRLGH